MTLLDPGTVLYIFLLFYVIGELIPYSGSNRDKIIRLTSSDRPFIVILIAIHCVSSIIAHISSLLSIIANASYISALFVLSGEMNKKSIINLKYSLKKSLAIFGSLFTFCIVVKIISHEGAVNALLIISLALFAQALLSYRSTCRAIDTNFKSIYVNQAAIAAIFGLIVITVRLVFVFYTGEYALSVQTESAFLLSLRLANAASFFLLINAIFNNKFEAIVESGEVHRVAAQGGTLRALVMLAKTRGKQTERHYTRIQEFVRLIGHRLDQKRWFGADDPKELIVKIGKASALYDLGKVGIPEAILQDPRKLSPVDYATLRSHPLIGAAMIDAAMEGQDPTSIRLFKIAREIVVGLNENWDGSGYPLGLCGDSIPKVARVVQVAIVYDELTAGKPGKMRLIHEEAVEEIKKLSGSRFDPDVVTAFLDRQQWLLNVALRHHDD